MTDAADCNESSRSKILVVYNSEGHLPVLLDVAGSLTNASNFLFEPDTGSFYSCSALNNGTMIIFGGEGKSLRQISEVQSCGLKLVGKLPFNFLMGACNTFTASDGTDETLLCFDDFAKKSCHR